MEFVHLNSVTGRSLVYTDQKIVDFLYLNLVEYGDSEEAIQKCLDYVFNPNRGGFVLLGIEQDDIVGVVIMNETGMSGYIPENILVYIAVKTILVGKGIGKQLMEKAISLTKGSIALHVEKDNTARFLYERMGFKNQYLEMRLTK